MLPNRVLLLLVTVCQARFNRDVCEQQIMAGTVSPLKPIDPDVPETFEVHVECYVTDRNETTEVQEYYDYEGNRGVVRQLKSGNPMYIYYDYNNNEILSIFPTYKTCQVTTLSTDVNRFLFGYKAANGRGHVFSPSGALHLGVDGLITAFMGSSVVRGIAVNTWYSCQYVVQFDASVNVYWSFSDGRNWDTALGYPSVPVRLSVTGVSRTQRDPDNGTHPFVHTYDFVHFKPYISRPDVFETPDEVVCEGRVNTKALPALSSTFSFTAENINPANKQVSYVQERYDYYLKAVKFRYVPTGSLGAQYGGRPLTEVHDFSTGVAYIMDEQLGNCTVTVIESGMFDDVSADITHVRLRTAMQFFDLDNSNAVYMGQKTVRGLPCDTWVGTRVDFPGPGVNATAQWSFQTANWTTTLSHKLGVPVQMHFHASGMQYDFNIFHFDTSPPDISHFDVSQCFSNTLRRSFDFAISSHFTPVVQTNMQDFKRALMTSMVAATQLSPMRITNIRVVFLANIHIRITLLDKAPFVGDVNQVRAQPELSTAASNLTSTIRSNSFIITMTSGSTMAVLPDSVTEFVHDSDLVISTSPTSITPPPPPTTPTSTTPTTTRPQTLRPVTATSRTSGPQTVTASHAPVSTGHATIGLGTTLGVTGSTGRDVTSVDNTSGYSPGTMGATGVGTLLLGGLLGTGSAVIFIRRSPSRFR